MERNQSRESRAACPFLSPLCTLTVTLTNPLAIRPSPARASSRTRLPQQSLWQRLCLLCTHQSSASLACKLSPTNTHGGCAQLSTVSLRVSLPDLGLALLHAQDLRNPDSDTGVGTNTVICPLRALSNLEPGCRLGHSPLYPLRRDIRDMSPSCQSLPIPIHTPPVTRGSKHIIPALTALTESLLPSA